MFDLHHQQALGEVGDRSEVVFPDGEGDEHNRAMRQVCHRMRRRKPLL